MDVNEDPVLRNPSVRQPEIPFQHPSYRGFDDRYLLLLPLFQQSTFMVLVGVGVDILGSDIRHIILGPDELHLDEPFLLL